MEEIEEQYLLLNFKEKIELSFFSKPNLFFKMVNLDTKTPLVQIGNHVFSGKYEDYIGTNLLFEEQEQLRPINFYKKQTPIHLEYVGKTTKILNLEWRKIPDDILDVDSKDLVKLEFSENYDNVLNKIENGSLDINEIVKKEKEILMVTSEKTEEKETAKKSTELMQIDPVTNVGVQNLEKPKFQKHHSDRYNMLKKLIFKTPLDPEYYQNDSIYNFNTHIQFSILKELYFKSLDYKNLIRKIDEKDLRSLVDVEASIADKIIPDKDFSKLTDLDKQALISLKNFDNLSIPMKLTLLIEHIKEEKLHLGGMSQEELQKIDEFGFTPKEKYKLLKSFARDLQYFIFLRERNKKLV